MGSFANLGALAGAASGWNEGSKRAEEQKQHKLDQEREERLLEMQHERTLQRDENKFGQEQKMAELGHAQTVEINAGEREFKTTEREARQTFEASEGEKDRQADFELEATKAKAAKEKERSSKKRFVKGRTPDKEVQNEDGSWETIPGVPTIYSETNKVTYLQTPGLGWVPEGKSLNEVSIPNERELFEKKLYDNPTTRNMERFENNFGYIPREAMGAHERYLDSNPEG
jgi:hypothetical protein